MPDITPFLWFDTQSEEAASFYVSVFPNSRINRITHYSEAGPREPGLVMTVDFVLGGKQFTALNGGPQLTFTEAVSFVVHCADQDEVDYYWAKLSEGGEPGPCGWLKDRFGLSWQIVPEAFLELINDPDPGRRNRAVAAMLQMNKLDLAALTAAADQT